jgi:hypothetical protein
MSLDDVTLGGEGVYDDGFYARQADPSRRFAERIVPLVLQHVSPTCAIDVGCGVGAWHCRARTRELAVVDVPRHTIASRIPQAMPRP